MYRILFVDGTKHDRLPVVKAIFVVFALALCSSHVFAEDWTTTDGTCYQNVRVVRVEDDAITIIYKDGGALIFLNKLPVALQKKFEYDPVKAKTAMEARAKADAANAVELQAEIERADKLKRVQQIQIAKERGFTNAPPK